MTQSSDESEDTRIELSLEKFKFAREVVKSLAFPLKILSFSGPLYFASRIVAHIAGKTTIFNLGMSIVLTVSVVLSLTIAGAAAVKMFSQKRELQRLRRRIDQLERQLEESQRENEQLRKRRP